LLPLRFSVSVLGAVIALSCLMGATWRTGDDKSEPDDSDKPTASASATPTPTASPTATPTATPSASPTQTPIPDDSPTPSMSPTPPAPVVVPPPYVLALWNAAYHLIPKFPQTLVTSRAVSVIDLNSLDSFMTSCGTTYQVDLYRNDETTAKLITSRVLHDGDESFPDGQYTSAYWKVTTTDACVTPPVVTPPATTPPATDLNTFALHDYTPPTNWIFRFVGVNVAAVHPGDHFTVSGSGAPAGSNVSGELHSVPVSIGTTRVSSSGSFGLPVAIPEDFAIGAHTMVLTLTEPDGTVSIRSTRFTVVAAVVPPAAVPAALVGTPLTAAPPATAELPARNSTGPIGVAPVTDNILTHGLQTIGDVATHPQKIAAAIAIGLVLLLFAVLPAHLLNATIAEQYERFTRRIPRNLRRPKWFDRLTALMHRAPIAAGLALTTITAFLFGFADPRFGFTIGSLRLILGLAIAMAVVVYGVNAVTGLIMRRRWGVDVVLSLRPLGLLLTVVGVVVSRTLVFSPGFLIGLVVGLSIREKSAGTQAWRAVLVRAGLTIGLGILCWLGFSIFSAHESESDVNHFGNQLFIETMVAILTEGVVALLIELLPFRLLEGQRLYERSRPLWAGIYLLAVVLFIVAAVPWEGNWETLGSALWTWIGIVVGFGIICTSIYLYFRFVAAPLHKEGVDSHELVAVSDED
jgi:hypothetical protein